MNLRRRSGGVSVGRAGATASAASTSWAILQALSLVGIARYYFALNLYHSGGGYSGWLRPWRPGGNENRVRCRPLRRPYFCLMLGAKQVRGKTGKSSRER